jgi:glycosyltransferase involved in cell wall biosynthesis
MACGRPILMAVRGDAADLITRAQAGIVCPPDDPEAMAQTVRRFMALPQTEREKMGASGREFYLSHMSLVEGAQRTRELLQTAASSRFLSRRAHA